MNKRIGIAFVSGAIIFTGIFLVVASYRDLTALENVLFQVLTFGFGLIGAYIFGRVSAHDAAREMIRPHARSAFRRLLSLYSSLSRLAYAIQTMRSDGNNHPETNHVLDKLEGIILEQIATANDALEDWRDIVPEDVAELQARLAPQLVMEETK